MMHRVQLHQARYEQRMDAPVLAFSFVPAERFMRWIDLALEAEMPREWRANTRFIADSSLRIYHAYGLGRNSPLRVYGPRILLHYAPRWLRGHGIPKVVKEWSTLSPLYPTQPLMRRALMCVVCGLSA